MSNTSSKGADGFHLLGLLKFHLQAFPFCLGSLFSAGIDDDTNHGFRTAVLIKPNHLGFGMKPLPLALAGLQIELMIEPRCTAGHVLAVFSFYLFPGLRRRLLAHKFQSFDQVRFVVSQQGINALVKTKHAGFQIQLPDTGATHIQCQQEALLALHAGVFHSPLLGDVSGDALGSHENFNTGLAGNIEPLGIHQKNRIGFRIVRIVFFQVAVVAKGMNGQALGAAAAGASLIDPISDGLPVFFMDVIQKKPTDQFVGGHPVTPYGIADKSKSPHGIQAVDHIGGRSDDRVQLILGT